MVGTTRAFAALKKDGSLVTWGSPDHGGNSDEVKDQLTAGVVNTVENGGAVAALKENGSVVTWSSDDLGSNSCEVRGVSAATSGAGSAVTSGGGRFENGSEIRRSVPRGGGKRSCFCRCEARRLCRDMG